MPSSLFPSEKCPTHGERIPCFRCVRDGARARSGDPETSKAAAARVDVAAREMAVLQALQAHGPMNCRELAAASGVDYASVTPRIKPLREKGLVADTGERRDRQAVWCAVGVLS